MFRQFVGKVIVYGEAPQRESRTVDVPAYSQDEGPPQPAHPAAVERTHRSIAPAPPALLPAAARQRKYHCGPHPASTRRRSSRWPARCTRIPRDGPSHLVWTGWPRYEQLLAACRFIFQLSGEQHRGGVASDVQLATRINLLREHKGQIRPLADEQMRFAGTKADEAVEDVLDFIREWPSHRFPRLLMILQAITEDVFTRYGLPAGNYKLYASAVETLFRPPMLTTLEEYGLPAPLSARLEPVHPARLASRPDR